MEDRTIKPLFEDIRACTTYPEMRAPVPASGPHQYLVTWYNEPVGVYAMTPGDIHMKWIAFDPALDGLLVKSRHAPVPSIIYNIHPSQSFLGQLLKQNTRSGYIGAELRSLANIRISAFAGAYDELNPALRPDAELDALTGRLEDFTAESGRFTGRYEGPPGIAGETAFDGLSEEYWTQRLTHRFSGKERKMPLNLDEQGVLRPALDGFGFSHIGKYPALGGKESEPLLEYMGLSIARAIGLKAAQAALVNQGPHLPPMLAVERFDIPAALAGNSAPRILLHDFYSINGYDPSEGKELEKRITYEGIMRSWTGHVKNYPCDNVKGALSDVLKRVLLAWVMNDPDLHSKNFSSVLHYDPQRQSFTNIEFAPVYDAVVNASANRFGSPLFYDLTDKERTNATKIGMPELIRFIRATKLIGTHPEALFETQIQAEDFIRDIAARAAKAAIDTLHQIAPLTSGNDYAAMMGHDIRVGAAVVLERARSIGAQTPDENMESVWKDNKKQSPRLRTKDWLEGRKASIQMPRLAATVPPPAGLNI